MRKPSETEMQSFIDANVLKPVYKPTEWSSKAFWVPKADPTNVRLVADFRAL